MLPPQRRHRADQSIPWRPLRCAWGIVARRISIAGIEVLDAGHDARRLIACLRERVRDYNVGIAPGQSGVLIVQGHGNSTSNLHNLLEAELDVARPISASSGVTA